MTKDFLRKILKASFKQEVKEDFFLRLYEPEYYTQPIDELKLNLYCPNALAFDYKQFNLVFIKGEVSCTGLTFEFRSERFEKIKVVLFYDYFGRKSIFQKGRKVKSSSDLKRVFNDLYKRFECPILD
jgi:hypothetical protein